MTYGSQECSVSLGVSCGLRDRMGLVELDGRMGLKESGMPWPRILVKGF